MLVQGILPVLADQGVQVSDAKYQQAYIEYTGAVQANATLDEINRKLDAYLAAKAEYEKAVKLQKSELPGTEGQALVSVADEAQYTSAQIASVTVDDDEVVDQVQAQDAWQKYKEFQAKVVSTGLRLVGGASAPGEMPMWERIAWTIGKALLPTMGVVVATALLAALSPVAMVVGGIVTGAALAGVMTYAYEKRMNAKYRAVKKEEAKIWRDVTVQAAVEAVMAPFNLATGGLFGMVGPSVGKAIGKVALSQAVITFAGSAVSSQVGGAVKNLWAKYYFKYPDKIEANEARIDEILAEHLSNEKPFSAETVAELDKLRSEIDAMRGEMYSREDAVKDLKRAGMSAVISGFAGSIISDKVYNSTFGRYADQASVKLFGTVAKGKAISSLFSTMPVNFGSGMAGAALEKSFISGDITKLREEQRRYNKGSPVYDYYERVITEKEAKREAIDSTKAGFDSMMNNFAVHAARLTVDAIKYNVYDGPKAKKAAVEGLYREKDPDWKKAAQLQEKYENLKKNTPNPLKYRNPVSYARALASHKKLLDRARNDWLQQSMVARNAEAKTENVELKAQIKSQYERDVKLNQMLELGRLQGGKAHLEAMKKVLKTQNPELESASDEKMTQLAALAIKKTYDDKFDSSSKRLSSYQEIFEKKRQLKAGTLRLSPEEARLVNGRAASISPSQYKAALVEKQVYELKSQNVRWDEVERRMPEIMASAERQMLANYGNSWVGVLTAEAYANGLAKYKYDPEGRVNLGGELKNLVSNIPTMIKNNLLGEYTREVNKAIISNVLPQNPANDVEKYISTFGSAAINDATGKIVNTVYDASSEKIRSSFFY